MERLSILFKDAEVTIVKPGEKVSGKRNASNSILPNNDPWYLSIGIVSWNSLLEAGFTTVRNVGARAFTDVALRDAINEGLVPGPRMMVSGPPLSISGGHCDNNLLLSNITSRRQALPMALRPCSTRCERTSSKLGMTPLQAIQTSTVNAADLLGWSDRIGSLDEGKFADITAVDGDRGKDVTLLQNPVLVMKGGVVYKQQR